MWPKVSGKWVRRLLLVECATLFWPRHLIFNGRKSSDVIRGAKTYTSSFSLSRKCQHPKSSTSLVQGDVGGQSHRRENMRTVASSKPMLSTWITEMAISRFGRTSQDIATNDVSIEWRMNNGILPKNVISYSVLTRHTACKSHYRSIYFDLIIGPHYGHPAPQPLRS